MADDKNQQPEESFKEKVLRSMRGEEVDMPTAPHETTESQEDNQEPLNVQLKINEEFQQPGSESANTVHETPSVSETEHVFTYRTENGEPKQEHPEFEHTDFVYVRPEESPEPPSQPTQPESTVLEQPTQEAQEPQEAQESVGSRMSLNHGTPTDAVTPIQIPETEQKPEEGTSKRSMRKKEDKLVSKIVLIVISTLLVIGAILIFSLYNYVQASLKPLDADDSQLVQVEVPSGSSNKVIGEILEKDNIIKSGIVFNFYTKFNNVDGFQSGYYQMSPDMTLSKICKMLQAGGTAEPVDIADAKVTIPEGYDVSQIASKIEKLTKKKIKADDFKALMKDEAFFKKMQEKHPQLLASAAEAGGVRYRLEGYLYPATYDYYKKASTAESLAEQMIEKTDSVMGDYYEQIQNEGYTVQQALTLASLVEKEGVEDADRKNIAQVFINRLKGNMPLQSDISILYALDTHKETVTYDDLEVDSPYNLYKNTGYGPGPFNSPSVESLNAVLNPTENNYFYFVADVSTGKVYFAETYEEHNKLVEKYVNN